MQGAQGQTQQTAATAAAPRWKLGAAAACLALCVAIAYGDTLSVGLVGSDAYPILAASQLGSWSDLGGAFSEAYMDGRFPYDFYRPFLSLLFGIEHALFGLAPLGYQVSNLAALIFATLGVFLLAQRIGARARIAPALAAALAFALYPIHADSLPVLARRHDALCCGLLALALLIHLRPSALERGRPVLLTGLIALLAMGIKEAAFVLPPLALVAVAAFSPHDTPRARLRHGLRASTPDWCALALALGARFWVLNGLGGFDESGLGNIPSSLGMLAASLIEADPGRQGSWAALATGAAFYLALGICLLLRCKQSGALSRAMAGWWVALAWLGANVGLAAYVGRHNPWQNLLPAAGLALALGLCLDQLARAPGWGRAALACALLSLPARHLSSTPWSHVSENWSEIEAYDHYILDELEAGLPEATPDEVLHGPALTTETRTYNDQYGLPTGILRSYSIHAWIELRFPEISFEFVRSKFPETWTPGLIKLCFDKTAP